MRITVQDVMNNKVNVRDYLGYDEETGRIFVQIDCLDKVLIDKSEEWSELIKQADLAQDYKTINKELHKRWRESRRKCKLLESENETLLAHWNDAQKEILVLKNKLEVYENARD